MTLGDHSPTGGGRGGREGLLLALLLGIRWPVLKPIKAGHSATLQSPFIILYFGQIFTWKKSTILCIHDINNWK